MAKNLIAFLLSIAVVLSLTACAENPVTPEEEKTDAWQILYNYLVEQGPIEKKENDRTMRLEAKEGDVLSLGVFVTLNQGFAAGDGKLILTIPHDEAVEDCPVSLSLVIDYSGFGASENGEGSINRNIYKKDSKFTWITHDTSGMLESAVFTDDITSTVIADLIEFLDNTLRESSLEISMADLGFSAYESEPEQSSEQDLPQNKISDNTSVEPEPNVSGGKVTLNTTFPVADILDVTLTGAEWCDSIMPPDTSGFYSYYEDKEGERYFVVHGTITSHASDSINIKWCSNASALINDKYNFSATMEFEDLDGRGFGEEIRPLQTRGFILYASISDEVYSISETVQIKFELPNTEELFEYFYDEDNPNTQYWITFSDIKES